MKTRCTLCRRSSSERSLYSTCACGWCLDANCKRNHEPFCPRRGKERWIGTVEF